MELQKKQTEKKFNTTNEIKIHENSFLKLKKEIKKRFPKLNFELNLISLENTIIKF